MSCEEMEEILARYASGDLTDEEKFIADVHLSACEECRGSLEIYKALESDLVSRPKGRSSSRAASRRIMKRIRLEEPQAFTYPLWSAPAIVGAVVAISIILTVALGLLGGGSSNAPQRIPGLTGLERIFAEAPDWIAGLFGGEVWLISAVYGAVAVGFVLMGSLMTLRFVRDR
jgi:anti-sigma factor RsiW